MSAQLSIRLQDMSARDKFNEAAFFLKKLEESKTIDEQRYFFSAFISAWRSVTFVLQKDYRSKYGDEFNKWYEEKKKLLSETEGAQTFLKLRTILQKEGNKFPRIVIEIKSLNGDIITYEWDLSCGKEGLVNLSVKFADGIIIPIEKVEDKETISINALRNLVKKLPGLLKNSAESKISFCIGDEYKAINFEEVLSLCKINLESVSVLVDEAEKLFG
jgi:hypothetical protein